MAKFTTAGRASFGAWFKRNLDANLVSPAPIEYSVLEMLQRQYDLNRPACAVVHATYTLNKRHNVEFVPNDGEVIYVGS